MSISEARTMPRRHAATAAAAFVVVAAALVAASERIVTAGGRDQKSYHYPTIERFRSLFPSVDVVDVQTATSPLYHLVVAWAAIPFGSSVFVTQILGALFGAALAAVLVAFTWPIKSPVLRALILAPLFASAYFWQSTLWLNTDVAALLWVSLALLGMLRAESVRDFAFVGVFCCLAVATRQTAIWLLIPVAAGALMSWRGRPLAIRVLVGCAPPGVVLLALLAIWGGLTPPAFAEKNNDVTSYVAVSYGFAVLAFFAVPLALASVAHVSKYQLSIAGGVGCLAAIPAILFPSVANSSSRTGGWVWSLVAHTPDLAGRSPLLVTAAFLGGFSGCLLTTILERRYAVVLASSFVALCAVLTAGSDLYQRYFELPVAILFTLFACALAQKQRISRQWPLFALAVTQGVLLIGIVMTPLAR